MPGAGGAGWFWHLVAQRLRAHGDEVVAPDLPAGDPAAGVPRYVEVALEASATGGTSPSWAGRWAGRPPPRSPAPRPCAGSCWSRRLARERAGVEAVVVPGGHLLALADPDGLVEALLRS